MFWLIKSEDSRTSMFVPITASNLRAVLHITKTLNFMQLEAAAWWRIQQLHELSPSFQEIFQKVEPEVTRSRDRSVAVMKNLVWQSSPHGIDFMILHSVRSWYLMSRLWPCCSLQHTVKSRTVVTPSMCHSKLYPWGNFRELELVVGWGRWGKMDSRKNLKF